MSEYRGYQIKPSPTMPSHYIVVTEGKGGKIPNVLQGMFTNRTIPKGIIDMYLDSKETK
jgi:hypothetical protein